MDGEGEYVSAVMYEGLLYGCGIATVPFLLKDLSGEMSDHEYIVTLSLLLGCFHIGVVFGKLFGHIFSTCFAYYNTSFVDFFCLVAILCFGFSFNQSWLFCSRIFIGFMAGIVGKVTSAKAAHYSDFSGYELAFGFSAILFSLLYWSSLQVIYSDSSEFIRFVEERPASIGGLIIVALLTAAYISLFIRRMLIREVSSRYGYNAIEGNGSLSPPNSPVAGRPSALKDTSSYHLEDSLESALLGQADRRDDAADNVNSGTALPPVDTVAEPPMSYDAEYDRIPNRYIRGCNGDIHEARRRWHLTVDWRREFNVDTILQEPQPNFKAIKESYPHYFHGRSKSGHPVYFERVGYINRKKLKEYGVTVPMLLRHYVFITEYLWNVIEPNEDFGASISVMDVENVGVRDLIGDTLDFLSQSSKIIQGHYVERCHKIFIVNTPFFFNAVWRAISPLVHENTRRKIRILGSDYNELMNCIDTSILPEKYGGKGPPLGSSAEEAALWAYVEKVNSEAVIVESEGADAADSVGREQLGSAASPAILPDSFGVDRPPPSPVIGSTEHSTESEKDDGSEGLFRTFAVSVASLVGSVRSTFSGSKNDREAFLGTKNEYIFDSVTQSWVLSSDLSGGQRSRTSSRVSLGALSRSRAASAGGADRDITITNDSSAVSAHIDSPPMLAPNECSLSVKHNSQSSVTALLLAYRNGNVKPPSIWEFRYLCIILSLFNCTLIFILEFVPIWLFLNKSDGGFGFSTFDIGAIFGISALFAAIGLYVTSHPRNVIYDVDLRNERERSVILAGETSLARRSISFRAQSVGPNTSQIGGRLPWNHYRAGRRLNSSRLSLQSLFWLGLSTEVVSLMFPLILLPMYMRNVSSWPQLSSVVFHIMCCIVLSSTIFCLAVVHDSFVAIRRAASCTSSQNIRLHVGIDVLSVTAACFAPVSLYFFQSNYSGTPSVIGTAVFAVAEIAVLILTTFCYLVPPKYPYFFYAL